MKVYLFRETPHKVEDGITVGKDEGVKCEVRKVEMGGKVAVKPLPRVCMEGRAEVTRVFDICKTVPDATSSFIPIYTSKLVDR